MDSQSKKLIKSFGYALNGIKRGLQERNMKIHLCFVLSTISLSILFRISTIEWIIVLIMFGLVITVEMINTSIEELSNLLNEKLKLDFYYTTASRDLSAAAVLISATVSAIVGLIIFVPKIILLL